MMRRIVGPQATAAMVLFGQVLDGAESERIGLCWRCVDDDALLDESVALAAAPPADLPISWPASSRRSPTMAAVDDHDEAVELELDPQVWSLDQPAFAERLAALQQKISAPAAGTPRRDPGRG